MAAAHRRLADYVPFLVAGLVILLLCVAGGAAVSAYVRHVNRPDPPPTRQYAGQLPPVDAFDALHVDIVGALELRLELSADRTARVSWDLASRHDGPRVAQTLDGRTLRVTGGCTPPLSGCAGTVAVTVPADVPVTAQATRIKANRLVGDLSLKAETISADCLVSPTFEAVPQGLSLKATRVSAMFVSVTHIRATGGIVRLRVPPGDYAIRARAGESTRNGIEIDPGVRHDASAARTMDISAAAADTTHRGTRYDTAVAVSAYTEQARTCAPAR